MFQEDPLAALLGQIVENKDNQEATEIIQARYDRAWIQVVDTGRMTIFTNRPGVRERTHNDFNIFGISNWKNGIFIY